jgi:hypothetical protein
MTKTSVCLTIASIVMAACGPDVVPAEESAETSCSPARPSSKSTPGSGRSNGNASTISGDEVDEYPSYMVVVQP